MRERIVLFMRRIVTDQRGQVLPWLVLGMTMMVGATGMSVDVGHAYVVHAKLQNMYRNRNPTIPPQSRTYTAVQAATKMPTPLSEPYIPA